MRDVVRCVEAVAAFVPAVPRTPPETGASLAAPSVSHLRPSQAPHLLDALHPLPPSDAAGFEDPFGANPFRAAAAAVPPSPSQHSPLLQGASRFRGADGALLLGPAAATPGAQIASANLGATVQPAPRARPDQELSYGSPGSFPAAAAAAHSGAGSVFGGSSSRGVVVAGLAGARPRAEGTLPRAQAEDWASPLASGMRFPALSRVSPDFGGPPPGQASSQVASCAAHGQAACLI